MAKGDANRAQRSIDYQGGMAQNNLNNLWGQNTDRTTNFQNLYQQGVGQNLGDYSSGMGAYRNFLSGMPGSNTSGGLFNTPASGGSNNTTPQAPTDINEAMRLANQLAYGGQNKHTDASYWERAGYAKDPEYFFKKMLGMDATGADAATTGTYAGGGSNAVNNPVGTALSGYGNFAATGGFSPQDIQNIRARSIAPIRGIFDAGKREVERSKALQSGYSPNFSAAMAKMARDKAYATSDVTTNAEAGIAGLVQQGKLAGLSGLGNTGLGIGQQQLSGLSGMNSLYGTNPGLTNTFGNQVLQSADQGINLQNLQNQLGLGIMNANLNRAHVPSTFQNVLSNIDKILGMGTKASGLFG